MNEFDAFGAQPTDLTIANETLVISPIRVGEIPKILSAIKPFSEQLMADQIDWLGIITQHGDSLLAAIAIAARKPQDWVEALSLDDAITLATALFEVNADFFVQRVVPTLQQASGRINAQINDRLAGILPSNG
ncbi:MAG: hypothetical protein GW836_05515 [Paraglaciecola sp.]|nr:hypothetical protein [Paraglaciecola sp.]